MTLRKFMLMLVDFAIVAVVSTATALLLPQFESILLSGKYMFLALLLLEVCVLAIRHTLRIYAQVWRYANTTSYLMLILSDTVACIVYVIIGLLAPAIFPGVAYVLITMAGVVLVTLISRFVYQVVYAQLNLRTELLEGDSGHKINVAIIGAGNIGTALADELIRNPKAHYRPYCFVDIDRNKVGHTIHGLQVYADDDDIVERLRQLPVQEIVIALPDKTPEEKAALYEKFKQTDCKVKLYDYALDSSPDAPGRRSLREINIEDLLFRNTISINTDSTRNYYAGKTVLVTGGGGSIGSELCRQIARLAPEALVIVDIYENNAYEIQQELARTYGGSLALSVEIASVRDEPRMDAIFARYRPDVVFHAAAHKHVPLMEHCPGEAIKNNVLGTYNTANLSEKYRVEKFILISTDKAVNPTNMMGASKRLCEMVVQCRKDSTTSFAAVRFGNVLGSNGSVIPLFRKQIAAGGPITLTDKRIIRYFMTIPEATQLVMEAGAMARSGELFVLDMGKPVKILDLAEKMIRLTGLKPYEDIDIVEIGLRPGEKLYEELLMKSEEMDATDNSIIFIERDTPLPRQQVEDMVEMLTRTLASEDQEAVRRVIREAVPTYHDPGEVNKEADLAAVF